jgi:hypothetical protein
MSIRTGKGTLLAKAPIAAAGIDRTKKGAATFVAKATLTASGERPGLRLGSGELVARTTAVAAGQRIPQHQKLLLNVKLGLTSIAFDAVGGG